MKIGNLKIKNDKVKDLPSKFKRFVQDQVFPMRIDIDVEFPEEEEKKELVEMCKIVDKKD